VFLLSFQIWYFEVKFVGVFHRLGARLRNKPKELQLFICFFSTNFWALQILPPLTEISPSRFVRKGIQKDWFVIRLLVYNWFKNLVSLFFKSIVGD
jgi:hypothetical protein